MMPAGRVCVLPNLYKKYLLGSDAIRLKLNALRYDSFFIIENLNRSIIRNNINSRTAGSTRQRIGLSELKKTSFYCPHLVEQKKIGFFFQEIERKIKIIERKIDILKKYKEGLDIFAYNFVKKYGNYIRFCDLFENKVIKNTNNIQQFTVGKHGIKKLEESNYDVSKHKVFRNDDLIIGIGIDEMAISNVTKGSVSPVYDVFTMTDKNYLNCLKTTLKRQLWHNRNFITKKSTRREFEVDKKRLSKTILLVVENNIFSNIYESIFKAERTIEILNKKSNNLRKAKLYFLNKMFI